MAKTLPLFASPTEIGQIAVMRDGSYQVMLKNKRVFNFYADEWQEADELATKIREAPEDPEFDELLQGFVEMNRKRPRGLKVQIRGGQIIHPAIPKEKVGPNQSCTCGSGKKFKKCCG